MELLHSQLWSNCSSVWSHQAGEELVPAMGIPPPALVQAKRCAKIQSFPGLARLGTHLGGSPSIPVPCSTGTSAYWASADTGGLPRGRTSREPTGRLSCGRVVAATALECVQCHFPETCPLLSSSARTTNVLLLQTSFGNLFLQKHLWCFP